MRRQKLAEKLECLSALNVLLNMDEKGDAAIGMENDEPEASKDDKEAADFRRRIFRLPRNGRIQGKIGATNSMRLHIKKKK